MENGGTITKKANGGKSQSLPVDVTPLLALLPAEGFLFDRIIVLFTVLYKAYFVEFGGILARK